MLNDGEYSVWFKTPIASGTGVIVLERGRITGRDTVIAYFGSYAQDGEVFRAWVQAKRFCDGQPSVFGIDEFELQLEGRSSGRLIACSGTSPQAPGVSFEATLIRRREEPPKMRQVEPSDSFDPAKFPKLPTR
jgi:hypothetical protein